MTGTDLLERVAAHDPDLVRAAVCRHVWLTMLHRAGVVDAHGGDRLARARKVRTPAGEKFFGQPIGTVIVPDLRKVKYLDPDKFSGDIAIRLHAGQRPAHIAEEFAYHARNLRDAAKPETDEKRRTSLLRLARQQEEKAARLRAVADLPLKPKTKVPNPRVIPAKPAPTKPNPRTVPPAPLPSRPMTAAEQKLADDFAAGRINKDELRAALTGKTPQRFDPRTTVPFAQGMATAGDITELAWTGNQDKLRAYLRRQNTSRLVHAAPFFGLHLPDDATHAQIVDAFVAQALRLEGTGVPELPTRESLMARKVADLRVALRTAGLPTSGIKALLVDRLLAALEASGGAHV